MAATIDSAFYSFFSPSRQANRNARSPNDPRTPHKHRVRQATMRARKGSLPLDAKGPKDRNHTPVATTAETIKGASPRGDKILSLDEAPANEIIFNPVSTQPSGRRQPPSSHHPAPYNGHRRTKDDNQLDCVGKENADSPDEPRNS